jgi:hypothetical protein
MKNFFSFQKNLLVLLSMLGLLVSVPFGLSAFSPNFEVIYPTDSTLDFGYVANGQTVNRSFQFVNNVNQTAKVYLTGIDSAVFSTSYSSLDNALVVPANGSASLTVSAKPNSTNVPTYEYLIDSISVKVDYTSLADETMAYQLKAKVDPRTEAPAGQVTQDTTSIDFGDVNVGNSVKRNVRFRNTYNRDVVVSQVLMASDNYFAYTFVGGRNVIPAAGYLDVQFSFTPLSGASVGSVYSKSVRLVTDQTDGAKSYYVNLKGKVATNYAELKDLRLSATSYDFGNVAIDAGEENTFLYIYNDNYTAVTIGNSDDVRAPFDRSSYSISIPARSNLVIEFDFDPSSVGTYSDTFSFYDARRSYSYQLKGRGVDGRCYDYDCGSTSRSNDESLISDFTATFSTNNAGNISVVYPRFRTNRDSNLDLRIINSNGTVVSRVFTDRYFNARSTSEAYSYTLPSSLTGGLSYRVELIARSTDGRYSDTDSYTLNNYGQSGSTGGNCAGFVDVDASADFCKAVKFAYDQGIFTGDTGGGYKTLRPNDPVSRAEAVAIMLRSVDVSLNTNSYPLPFYDVNDGDWYVRYLAKAVSLGAINGYADGTFRPGQNMTRAEFYKAFLKTVKNQGRGNFFLNSDVRYRPFNDVTLQSVNDWYLPYADFARRYFNGSAFAARQYDATNLGTTQPLGRFKPNELMTRAHIIELIYEMSVRNIADF